MLIDVVIPIYGGVEHARRCIKSVLAGRDAMRRPFELVLIDDASPGNEIAAMLNALEGLPGIVILRNPANLGFVATANRGMALHPDRDVVLLNSDTEVANDWLDRLFDHAYRAPRIATVTPFSNNATICSYPIFCADNPLPAGMTTAALDALFASVNAGASLDLPTAVGFCMVIRRACLQAIGLFDEQRFGRGYGEENDFCRRAVAAGWRNVLAADTFVFHAGGASFGEERLERVARADEVLAERHPDYFDRVREFVRRDPPAPLRRAVDIERARQRIESRYPAFRNGKAGKARLHVIHDMGGGIARWCRDFVGADSASLILKPFYTQEMRIEGLMLFSGLDESHPLALWPFDAPFETAVTHHAAYARALGEIVERYDVGAVLVSSLIGHALDVLETGLPTIWIGHDFFPACPDIHVHFGDVCSTCDGARLAECARLNHDFNPFVGLSGEMRLAIRRRFLECLADGTVTVVAPSRSMWGHFCRLFPEAATANSICIPHGLDTPQTPIGISAAHEVAEARGARLRIMVLGQLSVSKGVRLLDALLDRMAGDAEFYLVGAQEMGELYDDRPGVTLVRDYALEDLQGIVAAIRPHLGLLLSVWPETYSYTLTEMMRMGIPLVATRLGAFAERIIDRETGFLTEPRPEALEALLRALATDRTALDHVRECLAGMPQRSVADMVADYRRLLPAASADMTPSLKTMAPENTEAMRAVQLTAQRKRIKSLELGMEMRAERIRRLQQVAKESEDIRREAAILQVGLQDCERQRAMITRSRSWRLTAPLRWLRQRLRGAR